VLPRVRKDQQQPWDNSRSCKKHLLDWPALYDSSPWTTAFDCPIHSFVKPTQNYSPVIIHIYYIPLDKTRGNSFKLKVGRFRLGIKEKFFTLGVVQPWPRLPREAVAAPSLAMLKARLDRALSTLDWWKGSLPMAGGGTG